MVRSMTYAKHRKIKASIHILEGFIASILLLSFIFYVYQKPSIDNDFSQVDYIEYEKIQTEGLKINLSYFKNNDYDYEIVKIFRGKETINISEYPRVYGIVEGKEQNIYPITDINSDFIYRKVNTSYIEVIGNCNRCAIVKDTNPEKKPIQSIIVNNETIIIVKR